MSPEISSYSDAISFDELLVLTISFELLVLTVILLLLWSYYCSVLVFAFVVSVNFLKVTDLAYFLYNGYMQKCPIC